MTAKAWRVSPLSVLVAVVVAAAGIVTFLATRHNADTQNRHLLRDQTIQGSLIASSTFDGYTSQVVGPLATAAAVNPAALQPTAAAIAAAVPGVRLVVDVFQASAGGYQAIAAAGPSQQVGELASGTLAATLDRARSNPTPSAAIFPQYVPAPVVHRGSQTTIGFAQATSAHSGLVAYFQFTIDPFTYAAQLVKSGGPFESLRAVLYGSSRPSQSSIVVATTRQLPLTGSTARTSIGIGSGTWLLVTQARAPLAGGFANVGPWVILALGLFLALMVAITIEVLVRRERYAAHLVAERTAEVVASQQALARSQRLSALGEMASFVGHELRNPVAAAINGVFLLRQRLTREQNPDLERYLSMIDGALGRATALAQDLMDYVREREPEATRLALVQVLEEILISTPPPAGIDVHLEVDAVTVYADRTQLFRILTNVITNAYQAMPHGGLVRIAAAAEAGFSVITVHDNGPGIPPDLDGKIFDPFVTTKAEGTGLGLAIVQRLVDAHHGSISMENAAAGGALLTLRLPYAPHATRSTKRDRTMAIRS